MQFTFSDIPLMKGKVAIITGGNSGIGLETAKVLTEYGAEVVIATRNQEKGEVAIKTILNKNPSAKLNFMKIDLSSLESVEEFVSNFKNIYNQLDLVINNAAAGPETHKTREGFGWVMGINYFGHFALTSHLLELLINTPGSRVVNVVSQVYKNAKLDLNDFHKKQDGMYGPSKLAILSFSLELHRRLSAMKYSTLSIAADPGASRTEGATNAIGSTKNLIGRVFGKFFVNNIMQEPQAGALNLIRAAVDKNLKGGELIGPGGFLGIKGAPEITNIKDKAKDSEFARALWTKTIQLTGLRGFDEL